MNVQLHPYIQNCREFYILSETSRVQLPVLLVGKLLPYDMFCQHQAFYVWAICLVSISGSHQTTLQVRAEKRYTVNPPLLDILYRYDSKSRQLSTGLISNIILTINDNYFHNVLCIFTLLNDYYLAQCNKNSDHLFKKCLNLQKHEMCLSRF